MTVHCDSPAPWTGVWWLGGQACNCEKLLLHFCVFLYSHKSLLAFLLWWLVISFSQSFSINFIDRHSYAKDDSFKCLAKSKGLWATVSLMCCWSCLFSSSSTNESICKKVSWKLQNMTCIIKQGHVFHAYLGLAVLFLSCGPSHLDQTSSPGSSLLLACRKFPLAVSGSPS